MQTAQDRLAQLLRRRAKLKEDLLGVDRLINAAIPIHQLPDEMLIEIFHFYRTTSPRALGLMSLMRVCARWRSLVSTTPSFWRNIYVRKRCEWLNLALSRCSGTPAEVILDDVALSRSVFSSILPRYSPILRVLNARDMNASLPQFLTFLKRFAMPGLHSLSVQNKVGYRHMIPLNAESFPCLRKLNLHCFDLPSQSSLYSQLHVLFLTNCRWALPLGQLLDMLEVTPRLSILHLNNCTFPRLFIDTTTTPSQLPLCRTPIALPSLTTFWLSGLALSTSKRLLTFLRLPPRAHVTIKGIIDDDEDLSRDHGFLVDLLPAEPWKAIGPLNRVTSATVHAGRGDYGIWAIGGDGGMLSVSVTASQWMDWGACLPFALRDLCALFPHAPITTLEVNDGEQTRLSEVEWADVFRRLPLLEEIKLCGTGDTAGMWLGLRRASEGAAATGASLCCQGLRCIEAGSSHGLNASDYLFAAMVDALRFRDLQEMRMGRLLLRLHHRSDLHEEYERYMDKYGQELRSLVEYMNYTSANTWTRPRELTMDEEFA